MIVHGLKTHMAVLLSVLLILAMFLIDFIVITSSQRLFQLSVLSRGRFTISAIQTLLSDSAAFGRFQPDNRHLQRMERLVQTAGLSGFLLMNAERSTVKKSDMTDIEEKVLSEAVVRAMTTRRQVTGYTGETWGVFWKQKRYAILSSPLISGGVPVAGVGVALSLDGIYARLRRMHNILLIYIFVNALLLTLVGVHGLSRVTVKPLQRLVHRADEYGSHHDPFFVPDKGAGEFNRLSKSLNQMLQRISDDKQKLQTTISSLEKANTELQNAQKDIVRAEKFAAIGRLSSGLAHEIGNPIGIILGYLELIKKQNLPEHEKNEYVDRAVSEINRINAIVGQLLMFSRRSNSDFTPVSVHEIIEELAGVFQLQPLTANIGLRQALDARQDTVYADPQQLRQVFLNLIINAADAIATLEDPSKGELTIRTAVVPRTDGDPAQPEKVLQIQFVDNGPGIPDAESEAIFDPFFTTKAIGKGTGLGLSVSYSIVKRLGGTIAAESGQGKGAVISIRLPIHEPQTSAV